MNLQENRRGWVFWLSIISFMVCVFTLFVYTQYKRQSLQELQPLNCTVLKQPRPLRAFNLTATNNKQITEAELKGQWTFLFFGFTRCHSICPTTMAELARMYNVLVKDNTQELPQVIMVTIDPRADVPNVLKTYVETFNRHFIGLTGDAKQVKTLTKDLGIAVMHSKKERFDHSGTIILVNPQGKVAAYFSLPHQGETMASDYQKLLKLYQS